MHVCSQEKVMFRVQSCSSIMIEQSKTYVLNSLLSRLKEPISLDHQSSLDRTLAVPRSTRHFKNNILVHQK